MTCFDVIISSTCFRHHNLCKSVKILWNWAKLKNTKNCKKTSSFSPHLGTKTYTRGLILRGGWGGVQRGTAPHHFLEFARLQGARKWRSGTRWGPNSVVYSHGHHQVFVSVSRPEWTSKFAQKSQGRSNLVASVPKWEWPTQWLWHAQKRWPIS